MHALRIAGFADHHRVTSQSPPSPKSYANMSVKTHTNLSAPSRHTDGELRNQLMRLNWLQYRLFAGEISELNLTVPQFFTLDTLLNLGGEAAMGTLARQAQQVSATMTGIIDRLSRAGLVVRKRAKQDRRSVLVEITPAGRELVESAWGRSLHAIDDILDHLSASERAATHRVIDSLLASMEE